MAVKSKFLHSNEPDRSGELNKLVADRTNRANMARIVKQSGVPADTACFEMAYELTDANSKWIYKVNCPGWLYVAYNTSAFDTEGDSYILLADSPSNLQSENNRLLYLQGSSGSLKNSNIMTPIFPGTQTYMYINADTSKKSVFFVPAAMSVSLNIYQPCYVEKLFKTISSYTTGAITSPTSCSSIFSGDWKENFKSLAGVWVTDEEKINWTGYSSDKTALIAARKQWLEDLGVDSTQWGYP